MKRKTIFLVGSMTSLLVLGLLVAVNATANGAEGKWGHMGRGFKHGMRQDGMNNSAILEDLGLPEDATRDQIRDAIWDKKMEDLGLTDESTIGELRQAMKARMEERHSEMMEKLGLSEDATPEEVREAMSEWRMENKGLCPGGHPWKGRRHGYGLGLGMGEDGEE